MFEYKLPVLKKEITVKRLSIFFTAMYILSIIPMLVMGLYDFPSADDFSMALQPHQTFEATGNVFLTIVAAFEKAYVIYMGYEGYYFSALLTCLCPGIYGEAFYCIVPLIIIAMLTFGVCYFFNALFVKAFKVDKHLANVVSMITLFMMIQFLRESSMRVEAFYWYSGAVNYTFTFGMAFFWLGLLIRCVYDEDEKKRKRIFAWACIWGFCLGGANYMTALELAICSVLLIIVILLSVKKIITLYDADERMVKSFRLLAVPATLNLIGFAFSCFAPGIRFREAEIEASFGPVQAVLISLYSTFDVIIDKMMRWETIVFLLILIPVFWKMGEKIKYRFRHPLVFTVFAYGMVSSNLTPPYYAIANLVGGRLRALAWMEFVILAVLTVFYVTVWARQYFEENKGLKGDDAQDRFSQAASAVIMTLLFIFAFVSALCVKPDYHYYSATSCLYDLVTGEAAGYKKENKERLEVLNDPTTDKVVLKEHQYRPEIIIYQDIEKIAEIPEDIENDPEDKIPWINMATAKYYNKVLIDLEKIER